MDNNTTLDFLSFENEPSNYSRDNDNVSTNTEQKQYFSYLDSIQNYFNIDTNMFLSRIYHSMIPIRKTNFILDVIENNPDIYGPTWILLTLVLCIGVTNSLVHFFNSYGEQSAEVDFGMVTAVFTLLSIYISLIPMALYFYMYYNRAATNYTYMEVLCTYGYNLTVLIPIAILYHLNIPIWRLFLIVLAVGVTFKILYSTFWPALKNLDKRSEAILIMALVLILQFVVITLLKVYYLDSFSGIKMTEEIIYPGTKSSKALSVGSTPTINTIVSNITESIITTSTAKIKKEITTTSLLLPSTTNISSLLPPTTTQIISNITVTKVASLISNETRN
uniref:Protein YIPF n=1 Tax=Parastrongyloides trichosuri TaxID=131310 RepID=A0A0N4ZBH7_PARTI